MKPGYHIVYTIYAEVAKNISETSSREDNYGGSSSTIRTTLRYDSLTEKSKRQCVGVDKAIAAIVAQELELETVLKEQAISRKKQRRQQRGRQNRNGRMTISPEVALHWESFTGGANVPAPPPVPPSTSVDPTPTNPILREVELCRNPAERRRLETNLLGRRSLLQRDIRTRLLNSAELNSIHQQLRWIDQGLAILRRETRTVENPQPPRFMGGTIEGATRVLGETQMYGFSSLIQSDVEQVEDETQEGS